MKCLCADAGRPGACGKCSYPEWLRPRGTSSTGGAPGCQSGGCGFEPRVPHEGEVAGSNPALAPKGAG